MEAGTKVAIMTGANCGIGFLATKMLCQQGYHVIMACRSEERATSALQKLRTELPEAQAEFMQLDTSSLQSVREFVDKFHATSRPLHILANNAGMSFAHKSRQRNVTPDGLEYTMATNYLGPFLLTNLLLDDLKHTAQESGEARIVNVSSVLHDPVTATRSNRGSKVRPLDIDDLCLERPGAYSGIQAYKDSKAALILFTQALADKLKGTEILINSMCPGFIPGTEFIRQASKGTKCFLVCCLGGCLRPCVKFVSTPQEGATHLYDLCVSDSIKVSGRWFRQGVDTMPSAEVQDEALQRALWQLSSQLVSL